MHRIRIIVQHNPDDPADDLRRAARFRHDLWSHSAVEVDPDSRAHGTHRDADRNAYFEFATDRLPEVQRVLEKYGDDRVTIEILEQGAGTECVNCGNITPELTTVCPNCNFRDIEACPYCDEEVPRLAYLSIAGELFECPYCHHRVRFRFNDPIYDTEGHLNPPLVRVSPAEVPVEQ